MLVESAEKVKVATQMGIQAGLRMDQAAGADFAYSGLLTEICCLGNVAKRVDTRIDWDAENMKATNLPDANRYVRTEYRHGWEL